MLSATLSRMKAPRSSHRQGFTVVELIIAVAVIAILAAVTIVGYGSWRSNTLESALKSDLEAVKSAMLQQRNFNNAYPTAIPSTIEASNGNVITYAGGDGNGYCVDASNPGVRNVTYLLQVRGSEVVIEKGNCADGPALDPSIYDPAYLAVDSISVAGDGRAYCAVRKNNQQVYCWGIGYNAAPTKIQNIPAPVKKVAAGERTGCALTTSNAVYCWGQNGAGQLGDGTTTTTNSAVRVLGLDGMNITDVVVRSDYSYTQVCVIADGSLYCWGQAAHWKSGIQTTPTKITGLAADGTITNVAFGYYVACVIGDGRVYCWGATTYSTNAGNLAGSTKTTPVAGPLAGKIATRVSVSDGYAQCAVASGELYCWGTALGFGSSHSGSSDVIDNTNSLVNGVYTNGPVLAGNGGLAGLTVTDVSLGNHSACAIANGQPYCWGSNHSGQLGNGTSESSLSVAGVPTAAAVTMPSGEVFTSVSTQIEGSTGRNYRSVCAMSQSAKMYCWGRAPLGTATISGNIQATASPVLAP